MKEENLNIDLQKEIDSVGSYTIPIVDICNKYGITAYREEMDKDILARIYVDGTTHEIYDDHHKVIIVNKKLDYYTQKLICARELMYYLIHLRNVPEYGDKKILKKHEYKTSELKKENDIYYNMAVQLLMPEEAFNKWYLARIDCGYEYCAAFISGLFEMPRNVVENKLNYYVDKEYNERRARQKIMNSVIDALYTASL